MTNDNSKRIFTRIIKNSIVVEVISLLCILLFTKDILCCIMSIMGAFISVAGFVVIILMVDRYIKKKSSLAFFFFVSSSKFIVIALGFYITSTISQEVALFYLLGLSVIVLGIIGEAFYQIYRTFASGRA